MKFEYKRSGLFRFIDVLLFRVYYKLFQSRKDDEWERKTFDSLYKLYPKINKETEIIYTHNANSDEAENFLKHHQPDVVLARCKQLLKKEIFNIPTTGTYVLHPGITPEYRNAYGCFWAIASGDYTNVGTTLLQIDEGIDTGPVYGYFKYDWDVLRDSHLVIQHRTIIDNLEDIQNLLISIHNQTAKKIDTRGRKSGIWGQPRLSTYIKLKATARKGEIPKVKNENYYSIIS